MKTSLPRVLFAGMVLAMNLSPIESKDISLYSTNSQPLLDTNRRAANNLLRTRSLSRHCDLFNDPMWKQEWYIIDCRTPALPFMNIVPVYDRVITGNGVVIAVLADGIIHGHQDLQSNLMDSVSYDACTGKTVTDHTSPEIGTRAAGIIAMEAHNMYCGVGIAFNAKLIGVNLMCGKTKMNSVEGKAFNFMKGTVGIYTILRELDTPFENLDVGVSRPISEGIGEGRNKNGAIYIVSSGNNKAKGASCSSDSLVNHHRTIAIASASREGKIDESSERCTAVFATAYTGSGDKNGFATTSLDSCIKIEASSSYVTGPAVASGIIALVLEANSQLTYRDVMHLIAATSEVAPLADNQFTWHRNGAGFWVSNDFGFGLLNAENMVRKAIGWNNVERESVCTITSDFKKPQILKAGSYVHFEQFDYVCKDTANEVNYVEFVEVIADIDFPKENVLSITLFSPTSYTLMQPILESRIIDATSGSISSWSFKTIQNWGENPRGRWTVNISANKIPEDSWFSPTSGSVKKITIKIHGTRAKPTHYRAKENFRRTYSAFRLPDSRTEASIY